MSFGSKCGVFLQLTFKKRIYTPFKSEFLTKEKECQGVGKRGT